MVGAIEPVVFTKLTMAFLAFVVLGLGLMVMIVMGGRYARRVARTPLPPSRIHEDRWYAKPLDASETDPTSDAGDEQPPADDGPPGPGKPTGPEEPAG